MPDVLFLALVGIMSKISVCKLEEDETWRRLDSEGCCCSMLYYRNDVVFLV